MNNDDKYINDIKKILKKKISKLNYEEIEKLLTYQEKNNKEIKKDLMNKKIIYIN